jgi:hypothetical protein
MNKADSSGRLTPEFVAELEARTAGNLAHMVANLPNNAARKVFLQGYAGVAGREKAERLKADAVALLKNR